MHCSMSMRQVIDSLSVIDIITHVWQSQSISSTCFIVSLSTTCVLRIVGVWPCICRMNMSECHMNMSWNIRCIIDFVSTRLLYVNPFVPGLNDVKCACIVVFNSHVVGQAFENNLKSFVVGTTIERDINFPVVGKPFECDINSPWWGQQSSAISNPRGGDTTISVTTATLYSDTMLINFINLQTCADSQWLQR